MLTSFPKIKQLLNRHQFHILFFYTLIVIAFFGIYLQPDYATDTYADVMANPDHIISNFLQGGRFITALGYIFFRGFHIDVQFVSFISTLLALVCLVFALFFLEELFYKQLIHNRIWSVILPLLIILNPFIIELLLYVEKGIMLFSVLCCVLAACQYEAYLRLHHRSNLIYSIALSILATFCYQGVVGLFIVLATIITIAKSTNFRVFAKNTCVSVFIYAIGPILNFIMIKLVSSGGRTSGTINIGESFAKIVSGAINMFNLFRIVPSFCYWLALVLIVICWLIYSRKIHQRIFSHKNLLVLLQILYICLVVSLAALAPQVAQQTSSIWVVSRSTYVFGSILGIVLTIIIIGQPKITTNILWRRSTAIIICVVIGIQYICFNKISIDHYSSIATDRLRAEQIGRLIQEYEAKYDIRIESIMPARDQNMIYVYPGIFASGDINITAFSTSWSDVASIGYWNERRFERLEADAEWTKYCNQHDWQDFTMEQVRFVGKTLQICWY